jgi:hypothetical protein
MSSVPSSVPDVIHRLQAIEASAPHTDGIVCFARLYRQVTQDVDAELNRQGFSDAPFMERLDVSFAGLFFSALETHERDAASAPPRVDAVVHGTVASWDRSSSVRTRGDERAHQP